MKKTLLIIVAVAMLSHYSSAQSKFTFNTRAWSTNYWTTLIYEAAHTTLEYLVFSEDQTAFSRIVPSSDLVFPVGLQKEGFEGNDIYGPYHRAFGNPFKRPGDFGLGVDMSFKPGFWGLYAGAFFKGQELCFMNDVNLRGLYVQPRAGLIMGRKANLEAGVYYDYAVAAIGSYPSVDKDMVMNGLGLDFSLSFNLVDKQIPMISFMMPLHNFLNEDYAGGVFKGMKRRVGYIMLTQRIAF